MRAFHHQHLVSSLPFTNKVETRGFKIRVNKIRVLPGGFNLAFAQLVSQMFGILLGLGVLGKVRVGIARQILIGRLNIIVDVVVVVVVVVNIILLSVSVLVVRFAILLKVILSSLMGYLVTCI